MRLPELAIKNHQFMLVMVFLLTLLGVVSFFTMPRSEDPQFEFAGVNLVVIYPGANPGDLESAVVDPLEDAINTLDDLRRVETRIEDGVARVGIDFLSGTDPDEAYDDVVRVVNEVRPSLPPEVVAVEIIQPSPTDVTVLQLALVGEGAGYRTLQREAETLQQRLERVGGVKRVETWAYPEAEVRVALDLDAMGAHGVSLGRVMQAVQDGSTNLPGGDLDLGGRRFNLQTSGDFASLHDIRRTIVAGDGHEIIYLDDLADVHLGHADETYRARYNGERSVFITVIQRQGTNIFDVMEGLRPVVATFATSLPEGVRLETAFDQSESVEARVGGFFSSLLQGVVLVGLVILLALGLRAAGVVILAIPVSILIGIAAVDASGYGLQQISIVGLVIALGLLVDNAIVVTENVGRFLKPGESSMAAAIRGTGEVGWAIVSATVTTVLAFVPMVAIQTGSGEFIRSLPVTVIYALLASLLVSLVLTPYLSSRWLRAPDVTASAPRTSWLQRQLQRVIDGPYRRTLAFALRRPVVVLAAAAVVLAGSLSLFPAVGVTLFPKAEKPQFMVDIEMPEGTSLDRTDAAVRFVEEVLAARPEVRRYAANVGRGNPRVYYNVIPEREKRTLGQVLVELDDFSTAPVVVPALKQAFARYPGARITVHEFENGPPVEAPIAIKVLGPELDLLRTLATDIEAIMAQTQGTENVDNPLAIPKTDLHVRINRDKAGLLGVPLAEIDRTVRAGMAGLPVATYRDAEGEDHDVVVRLPMDGRPSLDALDRISVSSVQGASIPLRQVASVTFKAEPKRIDHYNFERAATITSDVLDGFTELEVTGRVLEALEAYDWPPGYQYQAGGTIEEQREGFAGMLRALVVALLGIFGVLVLQFRSFSQPLIIFVAIPLAIIGAILGLFVTGYTFSFTAFIGVTSLVGIVINNAIILVDYANQRRAAGASLTEAIDHASRTRFTPILLTTLTTIGGLLPLTLTGSTLWSPLGVVIIGGLAVSTVLTLVVVPVLYKLFTRAQPVPA